MGFRQKYYTEEEFDTVLSYILDYLKDYNGQKQGIDVDRCHYVNPEIMVLSDDSDELAFATIGMGANSMNAINSADRNCEIIAYASKDVEKGSRDFSVIVEEITGLVNYPFENDTYLSNGHIVMLSESFRETFGYPYAMLFSIFEPLKLNEKIVNFLLFIPVYRDETEWIKENKDGYLRFIGEYMNSFDLNDNDMARIDISRDHIIPDEIS